MNFDPTMEQSQLLARIREVLDEQVRLHAEEWDRGSVVPREAIDALGSAGASGIYTPSEYGGQGLDTVAYALAIEEISTVLPSLGITHSVSNSLFCNPIVKFGTPEQIGRYATPVASGRAVGAFALTELDAGSDATRLSTRAVMRNGGYVLSGEKVMVTSGGIADTFLVVAATEPEKTSRGLTAFVVPRDTAGVSLGEREETMGMRGTDVRSIRFDDVTLGPEHRLGQENHGMAILTEAINSGRIGVGAQAVGIARGAFEKAVRYAAKRKQFGKELHRIGAVREMIANMATEIDAARLTVLHAAQVRDRGEPFFADAARAKLTASVMCSQVTSLAIQVHGGWGYMTSMGVERYHRDAKLTELYEGTSEMQRIVLAGTMTRG